MQITIFGDGGLGRSVATAAAARGDHVRVIGRPASQRRHADDLDGIEAGTVVEASRAEAVVPNLEAALRAGCRCVVIATTGWGIDRATVEALVRDHDATAVVASNFSLGVALFARLVDAAVGLFGPLAAFDPYLVEWHRRTKPDRPSGTAADLAARIVANHPRKRSVAPVTAESGPLPDELEVVAVRAGASPGMHLVGFDAPGETVELRLTARDRSAYAAGILAAADWLERRPRSAGIHAFEPIVDELLAAASGTAVTTTHPEGAVA